MSDSEIQERICKACGEKYKYPPVKSNASRFHCERCTLIPKDTRKTLEILRRKIHRLTRRLDALEKK